MTIMRVTWGKIRPGKWDEYEKLWNEYAVGTSATSGLQARWLLRDTEHKDAGYSFSLWESEADLTAYHMHAAKEDIGAMAACFLGQYVTTTCDVRGSHIDALLGR